jgi:hypothetical protein
VSARRPTLEEFVAIARRHAEAEGADDLAGTLATLDPDPVYEFFPSGRRFTGMDATRRYYEHFFANVRPRIAGYTMHAEWLSDTGLAQEYTVVVREDDGSLREHRMIGILNFGSGALAGERLHGSDELLRFLVGPLWDEIASR